MESFARQNATGLSPLIASLVAGQIILLRFYGRDRVIHGLHIYTYHKRWLNNGGVGESREMATFEQTRADTETFAKFFIPKRENF